MQLEEEVRLLLASHHILPPKGFYPSQLAADLVVWLTVHLVKQKRIWARLSSLNHMFLVAHVILIESSWRMLYQADQWKF